MMLDAKYGTGGYVFVFDCAPGRHYLDFINDAYAELLPIDVNNKSISKLKGRFRSRAGKRFSDLWNPPDSCEQQ